MITVKEINEYRLLNDRVNKECERVCNILKKFKPCFRHMDEFIVDEDKVFCAGDEYWAYGGYDRHEDSFPTNYLSMSDDALEVLVDTWIEEKNKIIEEERKRSEEEKEKLEREQYEKLKQKYGEA